VLGWSGLALRFVAAASNALALDQNFPVFGVSIQVRCLDLGGDAGFAFW
jgi:hypothetical protein